MRTTRRAFRRAVGVVAASAVTVGVVFAMTAGAATSVAASAKCGSTKDFVNYVCGKPGKANPKLAPALIGWSNNQDGTVVPVGAEATDAAQLAVDWVNKHAGGISGHPLK